MAYNTSYDNILIFITMSKYSTIIGLGILVALMPFLGFPPVVKDVFFVVIGLAVAVIAYFSNIQYCNNCNQLIENGKHGVGGNKQPTMSGEVSNPPERRHPPARPSAMHSVRDNTGIST